MMTPKVEEFTIALSQGKVASEPWLVYDRDVVERNAQALRMISDATGVAFLFAVKSFPRPEIARHLATALSGIDISNANEARLCGEAGALVSFACPGLDAAALAPVLASRPAAVVSCENVAQVELARGSGARSIALRLGTSGLHRTAVTRGFVSAAPGNLESRFGFDASEETGARRTLATAIERAGARFAGFHLHHGFARANGPADYLAFAHAAALLASDLGVPLPSLNLGGGLWTLSFEVLGALCADLRALLGPAVAVRFEPGRLLARGAGFAIGRILAARTSGRRQIRVLNLSRTCHVRWAHPSLLQAVPAPRGPQTDVWRLLCTGPTCYEEDAFAEVPFGEAGLTEVEATALLPVGSLVVYSGITGYSCAWNAEFNGVPPAAIAFV